MVRRRSVVLVAVLVVLSGCPAPLGGSDSGVPATEPSTTDPTSAQTATAPVRSATATTHTAPAGTPEATAVTPPGGDGTPPRGRTTTGLGTPTASTATATGTQSAVTSVPGPTPVVRTVTGTPTTPGGLDPVSSVASPPGFEAGELTDPEALVRNHTRALDNETYRVLNRRINASRRSTWVEMRRGRTGVSATAVIPSANTSADYYIGPGEYAVRNHTADRVLYGSGDSTVCS